MPPLARRLVDEAGVAVLDAWIRAWPSCTGPDSEGDGVFDAADNCPSAFNPNQGDADGDGIGNACETACNDGVDNDGDLRADYPNDAGCLSAASTSERPACNDGVDNDGDGRTDGPLDIGCAGASGVRENPVCADGADNDGDGRIDFDGGAWKNGGVPLTAADAQCAGVPTRGERNCGLGFELAPLLLGVRLLARRRRRR
jgi:hypothetical protein